MVPGLRGPAGGPCKSEDITGWGLMGALTFLCSFFKYIFSLKLIVVCIYSLFSMWGKIMIPMYKLWKHGYCMDPVVTDVPRRPFNV